MDSIKTRITRTPQITGYKTVLYSAQAAAGTNASASYHVLPLGAKVSNVYVLVQAVSDAGTQAYIHAGYPAGVSQADSSSAVSADPDAFMAGNNSWKTADNYITAINSATKGSGLMDAVPMSNSSTYSTSGEYVVPVTMQLVISGSTATAGPLVWWVEYMFDPNIVWAQADLA